MSLRPIALLGGTFDPVHLGHLRAAWEAAEALDAEVHLMPANVPPHRAQPVASVEQRVAILRAALHGQDRLRIDERELHRTGPSYTIDTLRQLRAEVGAERPLVLLVGTDAFAGFPTWHEWHALFHFAHIVVMTRPGHRAEWRGELATEYAARRTDFAASLRDSPYGRIYALSITALEISATAVRAELAAGREPRYLLAEGVLADPALLAPYRGK
jgi:nicotinate-nucleotide adenylyltransferase